MTTKLVPLKQPPMSSRWDFAGLTEKFKLWRNRTGRLFAESKTDGKWYRVVRQ